MPVAACPCPNTQALRPRSDTITSPTSEVRRAAAVGGAARPCLVSVSPHGPSSPCPPPRPASPTPPPLCVSCVQLCSCRCVSDPGRQTWATRVTRFVREPAARAGLRAAGRGGGGAKAGRRAAGAARAGRGGGVRGAGAGRDRGGRLRLLPRDLRHLALLPEAALWGVGAAAIVLGWGGGGARKGRERPATCPRPAPRATPSRLLPRPHPCTDTCVHVRPPGTWPRSVTPCAMGGCVPEFRRWNPEPAVRASLEKGLQAVTRVTRSREGGP